MNTLATPVSQVTAASPGDLIAPTAFLVAFLRAQSGIKYAPMMSQLSCAGTNMLSIVPDPQDLAQVLKFVPMLELRHRSTTAALTSTILQNPSRRAVVELGSGFSPAGLSITESMRDIHFVESDLPLMIKRKEDLYRRIARHDEFEGTLRRPSHSMAAVDVLNPAEMASLSQLVWDSMAGSEIAAFAEGVPPYFSHVKMAVFLENLRALMLGHGRRAGTFVMTDIFTKGRLERIFSISPAMQRIVEVVIGLTGCDLIANSFESLGQARGFYEDCGFNVFQYYQTDFVQLSSLKSISDRSTLGLLEGQQLWTLHPRP